MSQTLFASGKIGCVLESYKPKTEKRAGEDVSVLMVRFRVEPFDAKLAHLLDDGVGDGSNIRSTVFTLNEGDPRPGFTRHDFKLALPRQNLLIFASPDTEDARVALLQAAITHTHVRADKDATTLSFVFAATFGPVDRDQLEIVHSLYKLQAFIRFEESEPLLDLEDDGGGEAVPSKVTPMWPSDQGPTSGTSTASTEPARQIPKRHKDPQSAAKAKQARAH